jgi:iron complex transport system ATP-binding protein
MDLTLDRLSLRLGGRTVLERVSAALAPGRVTAILGPNGAGKSSLLRSIAALAPHDGEARIGERSIAAMAPDERARRIGYLPQQGAVHWNVNASDLVALGRLPHRTSGATDMAAVAAAMAATGTTEFADRPVDTLSGGERARVLLARVLAGEPEWLLADEPLASLDPAHQLDILARLRDVAARGTGVLVVLHDLAHAARIADDVLLLQNGRLVAAGPAADTLTPDRLRSLFGVDVAFVGTPDGHLPLLLGRSNDVI